MFSRKISITNYELAFQKKMHPASSSTSIKMDEFKRVQPCGPPETKPNNNTSEPTLRPGRKMSPRIADTISTLLAKVTLDDPVTTEKALRQDTRPSHRTQHTAAKPEIKKEASNTHRGPMSTANTPRLHPESSFPRAKYTTTEPKATNSSTDVQPLKAKRQLAPKIADTISTLFAKSNVKNTTAQKSYASSPRPRKKPATMEPEVPCMATQQSIINNQTAISNDVTAPQECYPTPITAEIAPGPFLLYLQPDGSSGVDYEPKLLPIDNGAASTSKPVLQIKLGSCDTPGATVAYKAGGVGSPLTAGEGRSTAEPTSSKPESRTVATSQYDATSGPKPVLRITLGAKSKAEEVPTQHKPTIPMPQSPRSPSHEEDDTEDVETVEEVVRALWRNGKPFWIRDLVAIMGIDKEIEAEEKESKERMARLKRKWEDAIAQGQKDEEKHPKKLAKI
ncbi:hypothetical protein V8F33_005878 [Rhypophila sp. PSN 637]